MANISLKQKVKDLDESRLKYVRNLDYTKTPEQLISQVADFIETHCWTVPMTKYAMETMYTELFKNLSTL